MIVDKITLYDLKIIFQCLNIYGQCYAIPIHAQSDKYVVYK